MKLKIREDSVEITGYVNAVERWSKVLMDRSGEFVEMVKAGAFAKALKRNNDVQILLNHNDYRLLGSQASGNLELWEDNIGLGVRTTIKDPEVIENARNGQLVGWSFGFYDVDVTRSYDGERMRREINDLDLVEVSILNNLTSPAYNGTLVTVREDGKGLNVFEPLEVEVETLEERQEVPKQQEIVDYSRYEELIREIKELK